MQLVEVESGPLERAFGLAAVRMRTARPDTGARPAGCATGSPNWASRAPPGYERTPDSRLAHRGATDPAADPADRPGRRSRAWSGPADRLRPQPGGPTVHDQEDPATPPAYPVRPRLVGPRGRHR